MKNYLNLASVALAFFLASQSVQAMDEKKDKSKNTTVKQTKKKTTVNWDDKKTILEEAVDAYCTFGKTVDQWWNSKSDSSAKK